MGGTDALKEEAAEMNGTLNGRGGGDDRQVQGRVQASAAEIVAYWRNKGAAE